MSVNAQLSDMFSQMADVMQITGENVFKAVAFQKVARKLEELDFDVVEAALSGNLPPIEGVGESSRRVIEQLAKDGHSSDFDALVSTVPLGVRQMVKIPGLGPKTAALIWKQASVESIEQLETAIQAGKLTGLKGLGEKKIAAMLDGIRLLKAGMQRRWIAEAIPVVDRLVGYLKEDPAVGDVVPAGSFRRRKETIGDVDLIAWAHKPEAADQIIKRFVSEPSVDKVLGAGGTKGSVLVSGGLQVDLRVVPKESFGAAMQYFTGCKEHNVKLRGLAQDKGMTLNEWGLYRTSDYDRAMKKTGEAPPAKAVAGETEESVYKALGLVYVEPELREDRGEIDAAVANKLPKLIEFADIRGDLHSHTTASDGHSSIEQMAEAAKVMGYEYIAITDHSKSSVIANGLDEARLRQHIKAIRSAKVKGITILAGSEVDILVDGRLDYDAGLLAELDIVIASPHASLKQDKDKATDRLLRAIDAKYVNIIGHPTGRMVGQRDGLPLDLAKLFAVAAKNGTAMEINAGWPRWDLNDANSKRAAEAGVVLSINTDAHSMPEFQNMRMGMWVARRAWLTSKQVLNCWSLADLKAFLARKR